MIKQSGIFLVQKGQSQISPGFPATGMHCPRDCFSCCLLFHASVVSGFRLPHHDQLVGVCHGRMRHGIDRLYDGRVPFRKSSSCESGEQPSLRMSLYATDAFLITEALA